MTKDNSEIINRISEIKTNLSKIRQEAVNRVYESVKKAGEVIYEGLEDITLPDVILDRLANDTQSIMVRVYVPEKREECDVLVRSLVANENGEVLINGFIANTKEEVIVELSESEVKNPEDLLLMLRDSD